jgi:hypothetical protein
MLRQAGRKGGGAGAGALRKWEVPKDQLQVEAGVDMLIPPSARERQRLNEMIAAKKKDIQSGTGNWENQEARQAAYTALTLWEYQLDEGTANATINKEWAKDWLSFCQGKMPVADRRAVMRMSNWDPVAHPPMQQIKGVDTYLTQFLDRHVDWHYQLAQLSRWGPRDINELYIYYKFLVRGGAYGLEGTHWYYDMMSLSSKGDKFTHRTDAPDPPKPDTPPPPEPGPGEVGGPPANPVAPPPQMVPWTPTGYSDPGAPAGFNAPSAEEIASARSVLENDVIFTPAELTSVFGSEHPELTLSLTHWKLPELRVWAGATGQAQLLRMANFRPTAPATAPVPAPVPAPGNPPQGAAPAPTPAPGKAPAPGNPPQNQLVLKLRQAIRNEYIRRTNLDLYWGNGKDLTAQQKNGIAQQLTKSVEGPEYTTYTMDQAQKLNGYASGSVPIPSVPVAVPLPPTPAPDPWQAFSQYAKNFTFDPFPVRDFVTKDAVKTTQRFDLIPLTDFATERARTQALTGNNLYVDDATTVTANNVNDFRYPGSVTATRLVNPLYFGTLRLAPQEGTDLDSEAANVADRSLFVRSLKGAAEQTELDVRGANDMRDAFYQPYVALQNWARASPADRVSLDKQSVIGPGKGGFLARVRDDIASYKQALETGSKNPLWKPVDRDSNSSSVGNAYNDRFPAPNIRWLRRVNADPQNGDNIAASLLNAQLDVLDAYARSMQENRGLQAPGQRYEDLQKMDLQLQVLGQSLAKQRGQDSLYNEETGQFTLRSKKTTDLDGVSDVKVNLNMYPPLLKSVEDVAASKKAISESLVAMVDPKSRLPALNPQQEELLVDNAYNAYTNPTPEGKAKWARLQQLDTFVSAFASESWPLTDQVSKPFMQQTTKELASAVQSIVDTGGYSDEELAKLRVIASSLSTIAADPTKTECITNLPAEQKGLLFELTRATYKHMGVVMLANPASNTSPDGFIDIGMTKQDLHTFIRTALLGIQGQDAYEKSVLREIALDQLIMRRQTRQENTPTNASFPQMDPFSPDNEVTALMPQFDFLTHQSPLVSVQTGMMRIWPDLDKRMLEWKKLYGETGLGVAIRTALAKLVSENATLQFAPNTPGDIAAAMGMMKEFTRPWEDKYMGNIPVSAEFIFQDAPTDIPQVEYAKSQAVFDKLAANKQLKFVKLVPAILSKLTIANVRSTPAVSDYLQQVLTKNVTDSNFDSRRTLFFVELNNFARDRADEINKVYRANDVFNMNPGGGGSLGVTGQAKFYGVNAAAERFPYMYGAMSNDADLHFPHVHASKKEHIWGETTEWVHNTRGAFEHEEWKTALDKFMFTGDKAVIKGFYEHTDWDPIIKKLLDKGIRNPKLSSFGHGAVALQSFLHRFNTLAMQRPGPKAKASAFMLYPMVNTHHFTRHAYAAQGSVLQGDVSNDVKLNRGLTVDHISKLLANDKWKSDVFPHLTKDQQEDIEDLIADYEEHGKEDAGDLITAFEQLSGHHIKLFSGLSYEHSGSYSDMLRENSHLGSVRMDRSSTVSHKSSPALHDGKDWLFREPNLENGLLIRAVELDKELENDKTHSILSGFHKRYAKAGLPPRHPDTEALQSELKSAAGLTEEATHDLLWSLARMSGRLLQSVGTGLAAAAAASAMGSHGNPAVAAMIAGLAGAASAPAPPPAPTVPTQPIRDDQEMKAFATAAGKDSFEALWAYLTSSLNISLLYKFAEMRNVSAAEWKASREQNAALTNLLLIARTEIAATSIFARPLRYRSARHTVFGRKGRVRHRSRMQQAEERDLQPQRQPKQ